MLKLKLIGLSLLGGLLMGISWPETGGLAPLFFVALFPLLYVEHVISNNPTTFGSRHAFYFFYLTFLTFNTFTTWWIWHASAGGMIMTEVFYSLFMAITFFWFHIIKKRLGAYKGYMGLVFIWLGFEWLHFNWELSHPWNSFGNVFANYTKLIQWYEYTGVSGGTLWILLVNIFVFQLFKRFFIAKTSLKHNSLLITGVLALLIIPMAVSYNMYISYEEKGPSSEIVIVQPNIDPYTEKFGGMTPAEQMNRIIGLAQQKVTVNTQYIIAPETSIPKSVPENEIEYSFGVQEVRRFTTQHPNTNFIIGASSYLDYPVSKKKPTHTARPTRNGGWYDVYNTALQINNKPEIQRYHKSKLVLGVEKIPYPKFFSLFNQFAIDLGGTIGSLGQDEETHNFTSNGTQIAPIICYESIYGDFVASHVKKGAEALFIITNDGWWKNTPGHKQHMAYARLRAIENRRSIARSANTGISCFINQRGDITQQSEWWKEEALLGTLQLNKNLSYYTKNGNYLGRIAGFIAVLLLLWSWALKWMPKH